MQIILAYANVLARDLIIDKAQQFDEVTDVIPANRVSEIGEAMNQCDNPRLVILDTGLPDMNGLTGLSNVVKLAKRKPSVAVAVMGLPTSGSEMRMIFECGAIGYIPKNISAKSLFSAITLMLEGQMFVPAESQRPADGARADKRSFLPLTALTGREYDVLQSLMQGQSDKEIAIKYGIALVTVKHHLKSLRVKLGAKNRTHAVCRAIDLGLSQQLNEGEEKLVAKDDN
ncbi:MAG: response regulator transcription factor [Proteobacteria bacterium]|nr:response regulator transcription factor [Pseudomonadota bacterium]